AGPPAYQNALLSLYLRPAGLLAHYDLAAPNGPAPGRGWTLPATPGTPALPDAGTTGVAHQSRLLIAAFAPADVTVDARIVHLSPGLTLYTPDASAPAVPRLAASGPGPAGASLLLQLDVFKDAAPAPLDSRPLSPTLVLDLAASAADLTAGTIATGWRLVYHNQPDAPLTLTLDVYQRPAGTHPEGHLGSWSLPLPPTGDGRVYQFTLHPAAKTAGATRNGAPAEIYSWQGPPRGGDFQATLNVLSADRLLQQLPLYTFTLEGGRLTEFDAAPATVLALPLGAP
ncbi:MAG TPA: hypothetical protein VM536_04615, partial [Chloroflexia bacterium]|nr:hypothetical protein [Chloroflexia bacterium]